MSSNVIPFPKTDRPCTSSPLPEECGTVLPHPAGSLEPSDPAPQHTLELGKLELVGRIQLQPIHMTHEEMLELLGHG